MNLPIAVNTDSDALMIQQLLANQGIN